MKKILQSFLFVLIILFGSFMFSACGENKFGKQRLQGTQAIFNGFEKVNENTYKISISNSKQYLNVGEMVRVSEKSSWTLHTDITANETIPSKIASPLAIGDNTFYVCVTAKNKNIKLYVLQIRRRPIYIVSFNSMSEETIESQNIEENSKAKKPQDPVKIGYTFTDWDYNFDNPITSNIIITASYIANEYKITYNLNYNLNNRIINEIFTIEDLEYNLMKPTREDYMFIGWHLNENLLDARLFSINSIGDKTLFAEWEYGTEGLQYQLHSGGYYEVIGYVGNSQHVIIPNNHLGIEVKAIKSLNNPVTNVNIISSLYISDNIWFISSGAISAISDKIKSITIEAVKERWERSCTDEGHIYNYNMKQEVDITDSEELAIYMVTYANRILGRSNFYNREESPN